MSDLSAALETAGLTPETLGVIPDFLRIWKEDRVSSWAQQFPLQRTVGAERAASGFSHQHFHSGKAGGGLSSAICFSVTAGSGVRSPSPAVLHVAINRPFHECHDDIWAEGLRSKNVLSLCLGIPYKLPHPPPTRHPPPLSVPRPQRTNRVWGSPGSCGTLFVFTSTALPHQGWLES